MWPFKRKEPDPQPDHALKHSEEVLERQRAEKEDTEAVIAVTKAHRYLFRKREEGR